MIFKFILLVLILLIIYVVFFKKRVKKKHKAMEKEKEMSISDEVMVECPTCKTFVSSHDAVIKTGQFFCSKKCAGL
jgi:uncharacterized protein